MAAPARLRPRARCGRAPETVTVHTLRSAAISLYAARSLTINEVAEVMGQSDPQTTWKHYLRLFDRTEVEDRVRQAQASLDAAEQGADPSEQFHSRRSAAIQTT